MEVPGCEPYREYLYTYLREQPIWQSLRFWNAAIFDALQCERVRSILPTVPVHPTAAAEAAEASEPHQRRSRALSLVASKSARHTETTTTADSGDDVSSSGQSGGADDDDYEADGVAGDGGGVWDDGGGGCAVGRRTDRRLEEAKMHQNISFGQLG